MTEYQSILLIDTDIYFSEPLHNLFQCMPKYDFISSLDPQVALNGGFYLVKPNMKLFNEAKRVLKIEGLYDPYSGWNSTGPLFSNIWADKRRRFAGKITQSFAMETPQGFLYWFMHIHMPQIDPNFRAAQLERCSYNYRRSDHLNHLLGFECPSSLKNALEMSSGKKIVKILVCHNCEIKSLDVGVIKPKLDF